MVPAAMVQLGALPLTPNGKTDRKALPAPGLQHLAVREYVAPRTQMEQTLAAIWAEVLKVDRVGVHDNFFELGGHSLLALRVQTQIKRKLQVNSDIRLLFEKPFFANFADALAALPVATDQAIPVLPRRVARRKAHTLDTEAGPTDA
jgi:hypothetical protein